VNSRPISEKGRVLLGYKRGRSRESLFMPRDKFGKRATYVVYWGKKSPLEDHGKKEMLNSEGGGRSGRGGTEQEIGYQVVQKEKCW